MRKFIMIVIVTVMSIFATNVASAMTEAEAEVAQYVRDTVEGSTNVDARFCADAWQHGGQFVAKMNKGILVCSKHYIGVGYYR